MSPTRRHVVSAIAVGGFVPGTIATAEAQNDDEEGFAPDITINDNNLVATIGERDDDVDPDTVTIYTATGGEYEFDGAAPNPWQAGEAFDVGYTHDDSRARLQSWDGVIERVTATKDGRTVSATNDGESSLEVTCSLWKTPDQPPTQFEVVSEGARKQHMSRGEDDLSADQRQYGSPGRALQTVAERNREIAMRVDFDGCQPETEKALRFDCTSVTVEPEELNQGEDEIEDVQLGFADGTFESPSGSADDGAFELPVTLSGSGDNEGKIIERLEFKVEGGEYTYRNLEADQCLAQQGSGSEDDNGGSEDDNSSSDDDNASDDEGNDGSDDGSNNDGDTNDGDGGSNDDGSNTNDGGDGTDDDSTTTDDSNTNDDGTGSSDGSGDDSGSQGPGTDSDSGGDGSSPSGDSTGSQDGGSDSSSGGSSSGSSGSSSGGSSGGDFSSSSGGDDSGGLLDTDSDEPTETPAANRSTTENVTVNGTDRTSGANDTSTTNGSTGGGNGSAGGSSDPGIATGTPADDQPGLGFATGLGGLLGFGEFARRKLGVDDEE